MQLMRFKIVDKMTSKGPALAIVDSEDVLYAAIGYLYKNDDVKDDAERTKEFIAAAYWGGTMLREHFGLKLEKLKKEYRVIGSTTREWYGVTPRTVFGRDKRTADKLLECLTFAYNRGTGLSSQAALKKSLRQNADRRSGLPFN